MTLSMQFGMAQARVFDNVRLAIKSGNTKSLTLYMSDFVSLKVESSEGVYGKKQASFVLDKFFTKNPCTDFKYVHIGASPGGSKYCIGDYSSSTGKTYRVFIYYRLEEGNYLIDKISFDLE